ncbi:MAG: amino acid adenylation domain-containing protein [Herbinix sp.]|nr:amino acid adenylation domain-containing protein [Herbinix sp.]
MDKISKYIYQQVISKNLSSAEASVLIKELSGNTKRENEEDIAIIGLDCKFPDADDASEYWDNLINGRESIRKFPESRRVDIDGILARDEGVSSVSEDDYQIQGYLNEIDKFDSAFFNISPMEAKVMEPAQRILLEATWRAIEDASIGENSLYGTRTGVYVGRAHLGEPKYKDYLEDKDQITFTGSVSGILASRISYILNLHGPSIVVDTACSSGLVALHLASQALKHNECELAIASGISINIMPSKQNAVEMLESPNNILKPFDKESSGTVWGEGVGVLVLKPLSKAIENHDNIYAVIKGSGINNDGASNGITAPSAIAQEELLTNVWKGSKVNPERISYIEAHGTGTALGDSIEIKAISNAFYRYTDKKKFCGIGTVKANIGHLIAASGIAGIIKMILSLKNEMIPGTVCFDTPSPIIDFCESPIYLVDHNTKWERKELPKCCGVSSFGLSGTNCHVILEEAPDVESEKRGSYEFPCVLTISAKKKTILKDYIERYRKFIDKDDLSDLQDICYTSNVGRGHYDYCIAMIVTSKEELMHQLIRLSRMSFDDDQMENIFYGQHKLTTNDEQAMQKGFISIAMKKRIDGEVEDKVTLYRKSGKKDRQLLKEICQLYVKGATVDWRSLYDITKIRLVSIPTYPFERKRSWIEDKKIEVLQPNMFYDITWKQCIQENSGDLLKLSKVLLIKSGTNLDTEIIETFKSLGTEIIEVDTGSIYKQIDKYKYSISHTEADYSKLLTDIGEESVSIVHMASVNQQSDYNDISSLKRNLQIGVYSLFHLVKVLDMQIKGNTDLFVISDYANEVTGEEAYINPHNGSLSSLTNVIAREYPNIHVKNIDIDSKTLGKDIIVDMLSNDQHYETAYRKGFRYVKELQNLNLDAIQDNSVSIKENSCYVICGGTGGIGLEIAKYFSIKKKVHMILLNRSGFPERTKWTEILKADMDSRLCHKINTILEIEKNGSKITCYKADLSSMEGVKIVLDAVRSDFGRINGVIQCAGVGKYGLLATKSEEDFNEVLYPKIYGTWILNQLTMDDELDFFIMFSSVASIFSMPGQADYAAANAYMDSFATLRRHQGKKALSINWAMWKEVGMAVDYADKTKSIFKAITTDKAIGAFDAIFSKDTSKVLIGELDYDSDAIHLIHRFSFDVSEQINEVVHNKKPYKEIASYIARTENKKIHPMVDQLLLDSVNQDVYLSEFTPSDMWVMGEHKVNGYYVIPGLAYPEVVKQVSKQYFGDVAIELKDFNYITPFTIHEMNEKKSLQIIVNKEDEDYGFIVASRSTDENYGAAGEWIRHVQGRFFEIKDYVIKSHNISELKNKCVIEVREINFNQIANGFFEFGPRWIDRVKLYIGNNMYFAELELPDIYISDLSVYDLHPAMMDLTVNIMGYILDNRYLPLSYSSFKIYGKMPARCLTYITRKEKKEINSETEVYDIDLMDSKGEIFGELRDYVIKRVHEFSKLEPNVAKMKERKSVLSNRVKLLGRKDGNYTETEEAVAIVWGKSLGYDEINIYDNFYELGGDSILAMKLINEINKELNIKLNVTEIFNYSTISDFSNYLRKEVFKQIESKEIIPKAEESDYYELSSEQNSQYALNMVYKNTIAYNNFEAVKIDGELDVHRLEEAFHTLVKRHEILRTSFLQIDGVPVQIVHDNVELHMDSITCGEDDIEGVVKDFIKPFHLEEAPLFNICLVTIAQDRHILFLDIHHIISDGTTILILIKELISLYQGNTLPDLKIQYKDFAAWQKINFDDEKMKEQERYWLSILSDELPILNLPLDYQRPKTQSLVGETIRLTLNRDITDSLKQLANKTETTLYMVFLALYNILLMKYTSQEDIIIGSPISGRRYADLENMLGMYVNTLVMRNYPKNEYTFLQFLNHVKENSLNAFKNQDYQFSKLVEKLGVKRDLSRNPIFDTMFVFQNMGLSDMSIDGLNFKFEDYETGISKLDLTLEVIEENDLLYVNFEYCTKLFMRETIECMADYFINIIKTVIQNPQISLQKIELMSDQETRRLLDDFNCTEKEYCKHKTINHMFEEQVDRTPDKIAVFFDGKSMTYMELNQKANRLARTLRCNGVKADSLVAIMLDRSFEMSIGIYGIMKAGGAYVPIDPNYPKDRINFMLEDSGAKVLLSKKKYIDKIECDIQIICLEDDAVYQQDNTNLDTIHTSSNLAYMIYTSGSTGKPKGAMIEQYSVINRLNWMQNAFPIGEDDIILQKTPYTFDVSVWELFWWSFVGASVCFLAPDAEKNPKFIMEAIFNQKITVMHFVPSMLNCFLDYIEGQTDVDKLKSLKYVFSSGEALHLQQVERFNRILNQAFNTKLINLYGPTEATVDVSYFDCSTDTQLKIVPIGKPIDNIILVILDKYDVLQPIGIVGELCIIGDGLARGYHNRPELNAKKFVPFPYDPSQRMYRTGDLARWLPDGNIEYFGRMDFQIKLRGFRIELGEIEECLLKCYEIKESLVMMKDDNDNKYICAYYVSEKSIPTRDLRSQLLDMLPEYMVPSIFVHLDKMPLTSNGKVNRLSLPEPEINISDNYEASANEIEEKMVVVWKELLNLEKVGVCNNFFEMGGQSLKAISLIAKINKLFGTDFSVLEIFNKPTIREFANYMKMFVTKECSNSSKIERVEKADFYPISSMQKRVYIASQLDNAKYSYNMSAVRIIEGEIDRFRLEESFKKLLKRHESLRTSFELRKMEIVQIVHEDVNYQLDYKEDYVSSVDQLFDDFIRNFDLSKAPLFHTELVKIGDKRYVLLFDTHHIICDGSSVKFIVKDLCDIYGGRDLNVLPLQYKDFVAWQNEFVNSESIKKLEEYWYGIYADRIPLLNLKTDFPRPSFQSFDGDRLVVELDREFSDSINAFALETGSTVFMVMLSCYYVLLSKYTGQDDIVVGSPIDTRSLPEFQEIIGMFVDMMALRNHPIGTKSFVDFLKEVKDSVKTALDNKDYPYEQLIRKLMVQRNPNRNPLFDVVFSLQETDDFEISLGDTRLLPYTLACRATKFDIVTMVMENASGYKIVVEYLISLYKRSTIDAMTNHFVEILEQIMNHKEIKLEDIRLSLNVHLADTTYSADDTSDFEF